MSRELTPRAVERLLEIGEPLQERPELGAVDHERYEIGPEIGRGGMGVVYEAWDKELGRKVALKILTQLAGRSPQARQRFLREAKAAARLVHPHIACVYDATPEAIAMQRIEGETLGAMPCEDPRELASFVRDAALAIHFAHGEGIVHRDLKPANLMVESGDRPHVYVMDFGLAKELAVDTSVSISGSVVGTPQFMAPEQAAGRGDEVGPATDVYGLGATLFSCLAGRPPFEDGDVVQLLRSVAEDEPPPLARLAPKVDRDLSIIVAKCMAKEPERRYASALALASDLDRWLRGEPVEARPPSVLYRLRRFVSRRQGAIAVGAVAAVAAFLVAFPFLVQADAERKAAERDRRVAEDVLTLSQSVDGALRGAQAARDAGVGLETDAFQILEGAVGECRAFLAETEVGPVWFLLGRLLRDQGKHEEAVGAFDKAEELRSALPLLPYERGLALASLYRDGLPLLGEDPPEALDEWLSRGAADLDVALAEPPVVPSTDWIYAEGLHAWVSGDLDGAIMKFREVLERDVAHREAHLSISRLYHLTDREELGMYHSIVATDLLRGLRRAYTGHKDRGAAAFAGIDLELQLLPIDGLRELLVDFNLLAQSEPGDVNTYGLRGQVQLRQGLRAIGSGLHEEGRRTLELAVSEYDATLVLRPGYAPALVNRGVCQAELARVLAKQGDPEAPARIDGALADYEAALRAAPRLAVARYDRALLLAHRSRLAVYARRAEDARGDLERARRDVAEALLALESEHPWRARMAALADELN